MNLLMLVAMPLVCALAMPLVPSARAKQVGVVGTLLPVAWFVYLAMQFDWRFNGDQFNAEFPFIPGLGLNLAVAVDTISMLLVGLTVLLGPICVVCSFTAVSERVRTYYGWLLALQAAMTGVFIARDLVLFYICFEFTLVPLYVLINLYGSTNRKAAATKFFLFTFTGSIITLAGLVYIAWSHATAAVAGGAATPEWSFMFEDLRGAARSMPPGAQRWVFWALMLGFAVKVPLFPVHTWLPLAHTEAPTAGSVILAGVLLKLGTYGMLRFAIGFVPAAAAYYAPVVGVLAVIGILYAGLICWVQTDVKKLVAYSSVSHLGFCVLGLFSFTSIGVSGSVLYMINHGLSTGALFLLIGMVYERYHTRSMKELGGLAAKMPVWATFMVFFTMASVGLPGLNGFVSEFMCLLGAFQGWNGWGGSHVAAGFRGDLGPWFALFAGAGMIVTAMYLLYMLGKVVWGPLVEPGGHGHGHGHSDDGHAGALPRDLTAREIGVLAPLAIGCIVLGMYPTPVLRVLEDPCRSIAADVDLTRRAATNVEEVAKPADVGHEPAAPARDAGHGKAGNGGRP